MPVISRIVSVCLRFAELVCASVVAGVIGSYLNSFHNAHAWPQARFIYTEVIAGLSIIFSLIWLIPFAGGFIHWPVDLVLSLAWFAAFGLLVNALGNHGCGGGIFHWNGITHGGLCNRWRAGEAFSFLSAIFWLASTAVGLWVMHRWRDRPVATDNVGRSRGRWYRQSRV